MSFKAFTISRELVSRLKLRYAEVGLTVTEGVDTENNPTFLVSDGTPATTEQVIFVRIKTYPTDSMWKNSVGLPQEQWTPHVIQIAMEATAASAAVSVVTSANQLALFGEVMPFKTRVEVYHSATGTVPTVATITSGNFKGGFESLFWGSLASV